MMMMMISYCTQLLGGGKKKKCQLFCHWTPKKKPVAGAIRHIGAECAFHRGSPFPPPAAQT